MNEVIEHPQGRPPLIIKQEFGEINPMQLLQIAVQNNADMDKLEKLMALKERWEATEARKAFVKALADFKANPPELSKNKHVKYANKTGGFTEYDHATLDHVSAEIGKALAAQGLSHRWDVEQLQGGNIRVTCVLTHVLGHSERVPMESGADQSGGKNSIQAIGSTVTYLQRYTLLAATGMAVKDQDDDGQKSSGAGLVTDEQAANIQALAEEVKADIPKFLKYMGSPEIGLIKAKDYDRAIHALEQKRKSK